MAGVLSGASDVNDGLVDFYLSTYAGSMIEAVYSTNGSGVNWASPSADFLSEADAADLGHAMTETAYLFLERPVLEMYCFGIGVGAV